MQFFGQEEGRIRKISSKGGEGAEYVFDYFLKDHLGNIRMVLTDEHVQNIYPAANLEDGATEEEKRFYNIVDVNIKPSPTCVLAYLNKNGEPNALDPPVNPNPTSNVTANSQKMYQLNGANGSKTGLGIALHVMAGDEIAIQGRSYYNLDNANDNNNYNLPITSLLNALLSASGGAIPSSLHSSVSVTDLNSFTGNDVGTFLTNGNRLPTTSLIPRAYINYIFFDEHLKYVSGGTSSVGQKGATKNYYVDDPTLQNIAVPKNGYLYVYCSNESPVDVFFDNLQVIHNIGPLTEETHYYPFGLTMAGISSKAANALENRKKYNGIELDEDLGIEEYEAFYRDLDPQTGRWWQIDPKCEVGADDDEQGLESLSPYNSMANDPIKLSDPLGDWPDWVTNVGASALGAVNAFTSDNIGGAGRYDGSNLSGTAGEAFRSGQKIGDVAAVVTGAVEDVTAGVTAFFSGGLSAPVSVPLALHGTLTTAVAIKNLANSTGSYTNTHQSGKTYSGKGSQARARESANRVEKQKNDPAKKTEWKQSKNTREAFKAEDKRIEKNGGAGNTKKNYNKINSPGKKYNKQDNL